MRLIHRHYAFLAPGSVLASEASECAADEGQFWPYRRLVFERQQEVRAAEGTDVLKRLAADLRLDGRQFAACLDGHKYAQRVIAERAAGQRAGVNATPTIVVQGQRLPGVPDYAALQAAIRAALGR